MSYTNPALLNLFLPTTQQTLTMARGGTPEIEILEMTEMFVNMYTSRRLSLFSNFVNKCVYVCMYAMHPAEEINLNKSRIP
jgi:hypothetical protein